MMGPDGVIAFFKVVFRVAAGKSEVAGAQPLSLLAILKEAQAWRIVLTFDPNLIFNRSQRR